jgi:hypothetical protein
VGGWGGGGRGAWRRLRAFVWMWRRMARSEKCGKPPETPPPLFPESGHARSVWGPRAHARQGPQCAACALSGSAPRFFLKLRGCPVPLRFFG